MTNDESAWNMAEKYFELVIAVKERYLSSLAEDDPISMIKWVTALYDEVFMLLEAETAKTLEREIVQVKSQAFHASNPEIGVYADNDNKQAALFEAMSRTQMIYRNLLKVMYEKKMLMPIMNKRPLGEASIDMS